MSEGFDLAALGAALRGRGAVMRVVIAGYEGSVPRETGTAMLVWGDGQAGTIGGGALELTALETAREMLADDARRQALRRVPLGPALGQCCGGHVTLLFERFDAAGVSRVAALRDAGQASFIRAVEAEEGAASPGPERVRKAAGLGDAFCGLLDGFMVEPFAPEPMPVWLYGAGHVGRAIVDVVRDLPLAVTWVDTGKERFPEPVPEHVSPLVAVQPGDAVKHAPDDAVHLVMTYSHSLDLKVCHAVLSRPFRHLGLIGSKSKKARFLKRLRELDHAEDQVARLVCPIGDRDLGKRPAAIAIGAAAELLRLYETRGVEVVV